MFLVLLDVRRDVANVIPSSQSNGSLPKQLRCKIRLKLFIEENMNSFCVCHHVFW